MRKVLIVRYQKSVSTMTCEFEWQEFMGTPRQAVKLAEEKLGGEPDGVDTLRINGSRVAAFSRGTVMVEIWEHPRKFDLRNKTRTINGWKYTPKPKKEKDDDATS